MYIYNVTINIDETVHQQWLTWMQKKHIPDMLATGKFSAAKFCRVLVEEETGGFTYAIQYTTKDKETLEKYYSEDAERLRQDGLQNFADKFVAFRTELEVISEQQTSIIPATEYLFTYGTLQDEAVQRMLYSRELEGAKDKLYQYKLSETKISGLYPTLDHTGQTADAVTGKVFAISGTDLLKTDTYEGRAYLRKRVSLASGIEAWVYLGRLTD